MKGGKGHQVREGEEEHQARECACPHFVPRVESVSRGCCAAATYLRLVHLADQGPPVGHIIFRSGGPTRGPAVRQGVNYGLVDLSSSSITTRLGLLLSMTGLNTNRTGWIAPSILMSGGQRVKVMAMSTFADTI
jgi:hypothetical protein